MSQELAYTLLDCYLISNSHSTRMIIRALLQAYGYRMIWIAEESRYYLAQY